MTDRQVPLTAAEQAVRMSELEGEQRLLQQQVKTSIDGVRSSTDAVQLEMRHLTNKIEALSALQHKQESGSAALERVQQTLNELSNSFAAWKTDNGREHDDWRRRHEEENKQTREQVIRWGGIAFGITLVGGLLVSGFVAFQQIQNTQLAREVDKANQNTAEVQRSLIGRADTNATAIANSVDKLHEIELYLARGGGVPSSPYTPKVELKAPPPVSTKR